MSQVLPALSLLDWIIFSAVLVATIAAVIYGESRRKDPKNDIVGYMIMGRRLTLPLFTATLVATWYGGIFGVTEISFQYGIYNFVTQGIFWYITYLIFALFIVHKARASRAITLPELVGQMFGPKASYVAGIFNFFNVVPIAYTISLGLLLNALFDLPMVWGCLLGTTFVMLYSIFGGFRAVVFSDLIQFFVMCSAVLLVILFSVHTYGGLSYLKANLPASHFDPTGGQPLSTLLVWGFIALSTLVDPNFYQRCFAAQSDQVAKRGIFLATGVWFCFDICTTLGGMYARAAMPEAAPTDAYLHYALHVLPPGLRGLFLAGILATILSTLDSYIFVASNTAAYDLVPQKWRGNPNWNRLGIVSVGLLSVFLAGYFEGSVKDVWKTLGSYSAGCLLLPVLIGYLRPKVFSELSFLVGSGSGVVAISLWRFDYKIPQVAFLDDLYIGMLATVSGMFLIKFSGK